MFLGGNVFVYLKLCVCVCACVCVCVYQSLRTKIVETKRVKRHGISAGFDLRIFFNYIIEIRGMAAGLLSELVSLRYVLIHLKLKT